MKGNKLFFSLVLGAVAIVLVLVFQANTTGVSSVLLPSDLAAMSGVEKPRLRVAGRVAQAKIDYQMEPSFLLRFWIHDPNKEGGTQVPVEYSGIKPDMFASGRDVILDGSWQKDTFIATKLMTQCPSKYEPPSPENS